MSKLRLMYAALRITVDVHRRRRKKKKGQHARKGLARTVVDRSNEAWYDKEKEVVKE